MPCRRGHKQCWPTAGESRHNKRQAWGAGGGGGRPQGFQGFLGWRIWKCFWPPPDGTLPIIEHCQRLWSATCLLRFSNGILDYRYGLREALNFRLNYVAWQKGGKHGSQICTAARQAPVTRARLSCRHVGAMSMVLVVKQDLNWMKK